MGESKRMETRKGIRGGRMREPSLWMMEVVHWELTVKLSHRHQADKGKVIPKGDRMSRRPA